MRKKIVIILLDVLLCAACLKPLSCHALDFDPRLLHLEYRNAPEGTAYIDILAKIEVDDAAYTELNAVPERLVGRENINGTTESDYEPIAVDGNSEIVQYCDDGYRSLSVHASDVGRMLLQTSFGYDSDVLELICDAETLYEKYGDFRVAYVGAHGEVLAVTDAVRRVYSARQPYAVAADGAHAVFRMFGISPMNVGAVAAAMFAAVCLAVGMLICRIRKRIRIQNIMKGSQT